MLGKVVLHQRNQLGRAHVGAAPLIADKGRNLVETVSYLIGGQLYRHFYVLDGLAEIFLVVHRDIVIVNGIPVLVLEREHGFLAEEALGRPFLNPGTAALGEVVQETALVHLGVVGISCRPTVQDVLHPHSVGAGIPDLTFVFLLEFGGALGAAGDGRQHKCRQDRDNYVRLHHFTSFSILRPLGRRLLQREPRFLTYPRGCPL